jgi:predicted transcriptional regulator
MRMMMILRDFQDIIAEILQSAQVDQGITKTRVMYEVQLSFTQIKEYFQYLQQNELVSYDKENRVIDVEDTYVTSTVPVIHGCTVHM